MKKRDKKRNRIPLGIWIIGIFCYVATVGFLLAALVSFLMPNLLVNLPGFNVSTDKVTYFGIAMIGLCLLYFFIARGLFKFQQWARIALLAIAAVNIIGGILSIIEGNFLSSINLGVNLAIGLYLLLNKEVKSNFRKKPKEKSTENTQ